MKNGILLILIFVWFSFTGKAQWTQSYTGIDFPRTISVVDDNVAWISDAAITSFAVTVDGGLSWTKKDLPEIIAKNHGVLSAVSSTVAYIVCNSGGTANGIYKTTDGGTTWNKQSTGFNEFSTFPDFVYFWNENEGVAVGDATPNGYFEIYTTSNGGDLWSRVPPEKMPIGNDEYTVNVRSGSFRVTGDAFFFKAYKYPGVTKIYRSTDKGLNWTVITTPYFDSFAFENINTGLLSFKSSTQSKLYSTTDQGQNWSEITATGFGNTVDYLPTSDAYFSLGANLSYSNDNGISWTTHPSFINATTYSIGFAPSGKIYLSGRNYAYTSSNPAAENTSLTSIKIINPGAIDVSFSADVDPSDSQDTANYDLYFAVKANQYVKIISAIRDVTDKSLVHLLTETDIPEKILTLAVKNIKSVSGIPVINGSTQAKLTIDNTGIPSSISHLSGRKICLYPNPANEMITVSDIPYASQISIYTVWGKKITEKSSRGNIETLDLSKIQTGIYLLKIEYPGGVILEKFIKN